LTKETQRVERSAGTTWIVSMYYASTRRVSLALNPTYGALRPSPCRLPTPHPIIC